MSWDRPTRPARSSFRLRRLAAALSALQLLEGWIGSAGLQVGLEPAWRASLPTVQTFRRPDTRLGHVEAVALYDLDETRFVEFVARVVAAAGAEPNDSRLYRWARDHLRVDDLVVDKALLRASGRPRPGRMIIDFGLHIEADAQLGAMPEKVTGWLHAPNGIESHDVAFGPAGDVADTVGALVMWALDHSPGGLDHVDLILPVDLLPAAAPEQAKFLLGGRLYERVIRNRTITAHWEERIGSLRLRSPDVVTLARRIESMDEPILWIDPAEFDDEVALLEHLERQDARAVGFIRRPVDTEFFSAALYLTPFVLWIDDDVNINVEDVAADVRRRWHDFPGCLIDEQRSLLVGHGPTSSLRNVRAVWDDAHWLENVIPLIPRSDHRASLGA